MKKLCMLLITCILLCSASFANGVVYEKPEIRILVDGNVLAVTDVPIIVNSRTLIPLRNLLVGLGVPDNNENIQWLGESREVKVFHEDVSIQLTIDSDIAYVNGTQYKLDSPAIIYNSRTYLPAKFVGEALGYKVLWDAYTPAVVVVANEKYAKNAEILNKMKDAMNSVSSYSAEFASRTLISTSDSNFVEDSMKYVSEKVDFDKKLMEILTLYKTGESDGILEYYSDSAKYYNRDYSNDFAEAAWQISKHDATFSEVTPFDGKSKVLDFEISEDLYGMVSCVESEKYCIYNISNNEALLNCLAKAGLYQEMVDGEGKLNSIQIMMFVDKNTFLPESLQIETKRTITNSKEYGEGTTVTENGSFYLKMQAYNEKVEIKLPN